VVRFEPLINLSTTVSVQRIAKGMNFLVVQGCRLELEQMNLRPVLRYTGKSDYRMANNGGAIDSEGTLVLDG
jgi:hypothetical protein